ncbi:MAG: heme ABC transporter ATP-binding protein [Alphaproteobacteria bacterium]
MLAANGIGVLLGGKRVLEDVSLRVDSGEVLAVLGPNGAGKTTLMNVLTGALKPDSGSVTLSGTPLSSWSRRDLARRRAVLPQHSDLSFPFPVLEVVLMGRGPHARHSSRQRDLAVARAALRECGTDHLERRIYTTLSGGERQRVHLARALAQIWAGDGAAGQCCPDRYLLLDEPTSSLDLAHQHAALDTARRLAADGAGVVAILHDLNLAAMYADRICMLRSGQVHACGTPQAVIHPDSIAAVYGVTASVITHPTRNCPLVIAA